MLAKIVNHAKKNKIKIALNPGRREISQGKKLLKIIRDLDVLIVNKKEASLLLGDHQDVFKKMCLALPKVIVAVTEGPEGAHVCLADQTPLPVKGRKVKMIDSTGAGDAFGCGFVGGLVKGWEVEKALQLGVANGASVVTKIGAKSGLIKEDELKNWLSDN
jgi:ribokinase